MARQDSASKPYRWIILGCLNPKCEFYESYYDRNGQGCSPSCKYQTRVKLYEEDEKWFDGNTPNIPNSVDGFTYDR